MDQFERLKLLINENNFKKIQNTKFTVLGIGGVGSTLCESLVRSGVLNLTIIDYDVIDITNLNRQIMTSLNNIGKMKTIELEKRLKNINNKVTINKISIKINENNIDDIFNQDIDYFLDCCDDIKVKKLVIKKCIEKSIKLVVCTGTGNKLDPSKLEMVDIRKTSYDPICKILREFIKKERITKKIICCASSEKPIKTNSKVIGSTSFVPPAAGLLIASFCIRNIIK